jgi:hypothetical protein
MNNRTLSVQFCSSRVVLTIRHPDGADDSDLHLFLLPHKLHAKSIACDLKMLHVRFGATFSEDIVQARLSPSHHSITFIQMTHQCAGIPTTEFKDVKSAHSTGRLLSSGPPSSLRCVRYHCALQCVSAPSSAYNRRHTRHTAATEDQEFRLVRMRKVVSRAVPLHPCSSYIIQGCDDDMPLPLFTAFVARVTLIPFSRHSRSSLSRYVVRFCQLNVRIVQFRIVPIPRLHSTPTTST